MRGRAAILNAWFTATHDRSDVAALRRLVHSLFGFLKDVFTVALSTSRRSQITVLFAAFFCSCVTRAHLRAAEFRQQPC